MARRGSLSALDLELAVHPPSSLEAAVLVLRTSQLPMRECTIEDHLATMARQAERDARDIAEILGAVISAVLDPLDLSTVARATANELLRAELLEAAVRWEARQTKMAQLTIRDP